MKISNLKSQILNSVCALALFAFFASSRETSAQDYSTVTGTIIISSMNPAASQRITFTPIDTNRVAGTSAVLSDPVTRVLSSTGTFSIQLVAGWYDATTPLLRDAKRLLVPMGGGTNDWLTLVTNTLYGPSNFQSIIRGVAPGDNVTTSTNAGVVTVNATLIGGSGDAGGTNSRQGGSLNLTNWSDTPTGITNSWLTFALHSVVTQAFDARLISLESSRTSLELMTNALGARLTSAEGMSNQFIKVGQSNAFALASMTNLWLTLSLHSTVTQAFDARLVSLETWRPLPLTNNDTRPITFLAGFTNSGNGSNSGTFDVGGNFKNFGTFNNGTFASFGSGNATFNGNGNFSGTLTGATFRATTVQAGTDNSTPLATLTASNQVGTTVRPVFLASTGSIAGLLVDTNNRVGIGTNAPGYKLNIQGTMGAHGLSTNASPASYIGRLSSGELVESVNPAASYQGGSATLTNLSGNPIPFTNILIGSRSVRLTTNAGVVTISSTNPVVNFSGGSTGSGPVATNQLDWLLAGNGTYRCTNAGASNQVFQITNGIPGESVTVDYIGTNFTLTFTATNGAFAGEIMWALNSTTNGATSVTTTNTVVVVRCVETNRYSAVYAHRRR